MENKKTMGLNDLNKKGNEVKRDYDSSVDYASQALKGGKMPAKIKWILALAGVTQIVGIVHSVIYIASGISWILTQF